jgi:hypothetical protein
MRSRLLKLIEEQAQTTGELTAQNPLFPQKEKRIALHGQTVNP